MTICDLYNFVCLDDITKNDYSFKLENGIELNSTLHFYWSLSEKAKNLMDSQFITGFEVTVKQLSNDTILTTDILENQNETLNITLEPSQWYLIIGRMLTEDNDTWGPEPIYKYFESPGITYNCHIAYVHNYCTVNL